MGEYKNILWIEDADTGDQKGADSLDYLDDENAEKLDYSELIKDYFGTELAPAVKIITQYREALERLQSSCYDYDLIVFDLDFKNDEDITNSIGFTHILSILKEGHVSPVGKNSISQNFKLVAGYYLYLYLAMKGFPTDRMVILTGNAENYTGQRTESDESGLEVEAPETMYPDIFLDPLKDIIVKEKGRTEWTERFYSKEQSHYYRIRRLVFQACWYWEDKLSIAELKETKNIPFNRVYHYNERNDKPKITAVTSATFIDMLEHIKMLFPVVCPSDPEKVYYQALRTLSVFHENNAIIQVVPSGLIRFHSCIRNFRNWSSHNKIETTLSPEKFAALFCIALRTYFSWETKEDLDSGPLPYEQLYGFEWDDKKGEPLSSALPTIWEKVHEKMNQLKQSSSGNKYCYSFYSDLGAAIRELGAQEGCPDMGEYLFVPLWSPDPKPGMMTQTSLKDNKDGFSIEWLWKRKRDDFNDKYLNDNYNRKNKDYRKDTICGLFMNYCYQWIK